MSLHNKFDSSDLLPTTKKSLLLKAFFVSTKQLNFSENIEPNNLR